MKTGGEDASPLRVQVRLFGAFEARLDGVPIPPLRSRKVRWLLALLILRHGQALDRTWLAETLWPESSHSQALYNLRQALTNLHHALGAAGSCLHASGMNAITLILPEPDIDVIAFDAALAIEDQSALERAVALYRGPLLAGCAEEWALPERSAREEGYLDALERLAVMALSRGESGAAVAYLRLAVQAAPLRERAQRALMQALVATGEYGAAVQSYRELRLLLHRELNTEPDPQTQALFERIRRETGRPATATPRRLPTVAMPLVGRETEVEGIAIALRTAHLLTLTGPGGVGKTRLAIAVGESVAGEYPDGVVFADLAPLSDPALIVQTIATALSVGEAPTDRCWRRCATTSVAESSCCCSTIASICSMPAPP